MRAPRSLALVAGVLLLQLPACGDANDEPEELVAVPYGDEVERHDPAADDDPTPDPTAPTAARLVDEGPDDVADDEPGDVERAGVHEAAVADGPPLAVVSEHLAARVDGAVGHDHLLADLTDDGAVELVIAAVSERGEGVVEVARWEDEQLQVTASVPIGDADDLDRLRLSDGVTTRGRMLVLPVRHQGTARVVMLEPAADGDLRTPATCPLEGDGTLRSVLGATLALSCDDDGASDVLVWRDGAFTPTGDGPAQVRGATDVVDVEGREDG